MFLSISSKWKTNKRTKQPSASSSFIRQNAARHLKRTGKFPSFTKVFDIFVSKQTLHLLWQWVRVQRVLSRSPSPCACFSSPPAPIAGKLIPEADDNTHASFPSSALVRHLRGLLSCPWVASHAMWKMQEFTDCWVLRCCTFLSEGN